MRQEYNIRTRPLKRAGAIQKRKAATHGIVSSWGTDVTGGKNGKKKRIRDLLYQTG